MEGVCWMKPVEQEKTKVIIGTTKAKEKQEGNCFKCKKPGQWARDCGVYVAAAVTEEEAEEVPETTAKVMTVGEN